MALSAEGNTAIVGGYRDGLASLGLGIGAAWVFTRSGGVWNQQGGKLVGSGATVNSNVGSSAALSVHGNTIMLGGPTYNSFAGAAWAFVRSAILTRPSILTDGTGITNGRSYLPGNIVGSSWVAIKGANLKDVTVDWSSFDFRRVRFQPR